MTDVQDLLPAPGVDDDDSTFGTQIPSPEGVAVDEGPAPEGEERPSYSLDEFLRVTEQTQERLEREDSAALGRYQAARKGLTPDDGVEYLKAIAGGETREGFISGAFHEFKKKIPFAGMGYTWADESKLRRLSDAVSDGSATDEEVEFLLDYIYEQGRPQSSLFKSGNIFGMSAGYMAEFAATRGLASAALRSGSRATAAMVARATKGALDTSLRMSAVRAGQNIASVASRGAGAAGRAVGTEKGAKYLGALGRNVATTSLQAFNPRMWAAWKGRMTDAMEISVEDGERVLNVFAGTGQEFWDAGLDAYRSEWYELFGETTGFALSKLPPFAWISGAQSYVAKRWLRLNPGATVDDLIKKVAGATGWHGVFVEMGEEVVTNLMRAMDPGLPEYTKGDIIPTWDEAKEMALAFSVFPILGGAVRGVDTYRRQKQFSDEALRSVALGEEKPASAEQARHAQRGLSLETGEPLLTPEEEKQAEVTFREQAEARRKEEEVRRKEAGLGPAVEATPLDEAEAEEIRQKAVDAELKFLAEEAERTKQARESAGEEWEGPSDEGIDQALEEAQAIVREMRVVPNDDPRLDRNSSSYDPKLVMAKEFLEQRGLPAVFVDAGRPLTGAKGMIFSGRAVLLDARAPGDAVRAAAFHEMTHHFKDTFGGNWKDVFERIKKLDPVGMAAAEGHARGNFPAIADDVAAEDLADEQLAYYVEANWRYISEVLSNPGRFAKADRSVLKRALDGFLRWMKSMGVGPGDFRYRQIKAAHDEFAEGRLAAVSPERALEIVTALSGAMDSLLLEAEVPQAEEAEKPEEQPTAAPEAAQAARGPPAPAPEAAPEAKSLTKAQIRAELESLGAPKPPSKANKPELVSLLEAAREDPNIRQSRARRDRQARDAETEERFSRSATSPHGRHAALAALVEDYMRRSGREHRDLSGEWAQVDVDVAKDIADAYEAAKHDPDDPAVAAAYEEMIEETVRQYDFLREQGYEMVPMAEGDAYEDSAAAVRDVRENKRLLYFKTVEGFGASSEELGSGNPLLRSVGRPVLDSSGNKYDQTANDLFRAVHDILGHATGGYSFGPRGEENAFRLHSAMYPEAARPAIASETRGQNSWVNFGRHLRSEDGSLPARGEAGWVSPRERPFAEQKSTILPEELIRFSRRVDPLGFFSRLEERVLMTVTGKTIEAEALRNAISKSGVTSDEQEWSGLLDFLLDREVVSREELLAHLDQNGLKVEERALDREIASWEEYTTPGERLDYRVLILSEPKDSIQARVARARGLAGDPSHYGTWAIAHIRFTTRTGPNGEKVLYVEEIQSDRHQLGRTEGYVDTPAQARARRAFDDAVKEVGEARYETRSPEDAKRRQAEAGRRLAEAKADALQLGVDLEAWTLRKTRSLPGPYQKSWQRLALRRILRLAVEEGFDSIGLATGVQQLARYGTEEIQWRRAGNGFQVRSRDFGPDSSEVEDMLSRAREAESRVVPSEYVDAGPPPTADQEAWLAEPATPQPEPPEPDARAERQQVRAFRKWYKGLIRGIRDTGEIPKAVPDGRGGYTSGSVEPGKPWAYEYAPLGPAFPKWADGARTAQEVVAGYDFGVIEWLPSPEDADRPEAYTVMWTREGGFTEIPEGSPLYVQLERLYLAQTGLGVPASLHRGVAGGRRNMRAAFAKARVEPDVSSKEELKERLEGIALYDEEETPPKKAKKALDKLWERMNSKDAGVVRPRLEGMISFYDDKTPRDLGKLAKGKVQLAEFPEPGGLVEDALKSGRAVIGNRPVSEMTEDGDLAPAGWYVGGPIIQEGARLEGYGGVDLMDADLNGLASRAAARRALWGVLVALEHTPETGRPHTDWSRPYNSLEITDALREKVMAGLPRASRAWPIPRDATNEDARSFEASMRRRPGVSDPEERRAPVVSDPEERRGPGVIDPEEAPRLSRGGGAPPFFSALERAVAGLKQKKFAPKQLDGLVRKLPGVTKEEMKWVSWDEMLAGRKTITKDEVLEWLRANQIEVREKLQSGADARHFQYQLPGGEDYRELLLTLPGKTSAEFVQDRDAAWRLIEALPGFPADAHPMSQTRWAREEAPPEIYSWWSGATSGATGHPPGQFTGGHYGDIPNVLAHVRFNERTGADGKRILFIEEIQSDWHKAGKRVGYEPSEEEGARAAERIARLRAEQLPLQEQYQNRSAPPGTDYRALTDRIAALEREIAPLARTASRMKVRVPDAPFKTTWQELGLKRMMKWAADNGFDSVAWTTGAQQVERYETSYRQVVDSHQWRPAKKGSWLELFKGGDNTVSLLYNERGVVIASTHDALMGQPLEDVVGKDAAERIMGSASGKGGPITIGGKGFVDLYDKQLRQAANRIGKRFGVKVGRAAISPTLEPGKMASGAGWGLYDIESGLQDTDAGVYRTEAEAASKAGPPVHSLPLTEEMRSAIREEGVSTFAPRFSHAGQISYEATPGRTTGIMPGVYGAAYEYRLDLMRRVRLAITGDDGRNLVLKRLGIPSPKMIEVVGAFEGNVGPGIQSLFATSPDGGMRGEPIGAKARNRLDAAASVLGYLLRQDAMAWHAAYLREGDTRADRNLIDLDYGRVLSREDTQKLYNAVIAAAGTDFFAPIGTERGARFLNVEDVTGIPNESFQDMIAEAAMSIGEPRAADALSADGNYIDNDWTQNPQGEAYLQGGWAGSPRLQGIANDLVARLGEGVDRARRDTGLKYGWFAAEAARGRVETDPDIRFSRAAPVDSEAFKQWFGDSKVVDADGKPLVVYHGSAAQENFDAFNPRSHFGPLQAGEDRLEYLQRALEGVQGGPHPGYTDRSRIYPVYLRIERPLEVSDEESSSAHGAGVLADRLRQEHPQYAKWEQARLRELGVDPLEPDTEGSLPRLVAEPWVGQSVIAYLEAQGFDGFRYINTVEAPGETSWVAFRPEQIKSATGNVGTFDRTDPDIRRTLGAHTPEGDVIPEDVPDIRATTDNTRTRVHSYHRKKDFINTAESLAEAWSDAFYRVGKLVGAARERFLQRGDILDEEGRPRDGSPIELVHGELEVSEELDPWLQETLRRGRTKDRNVSLLREFINPIKEAIRKKKPKLHMPDSANHNAPLAGDGAAFGDALEGSAAVDLFLWARHASERNEEVSRRDETRGHESRPGAGMTTSRAKWIVEQALTGEHADAFKEIAAMVDAMNSSVLDGWVEDGLETQEFVDLLRGTYEFYVPLRNELSALESDMPGIGRGVDIRRRETRRALGRTTPPGSPLAWSFAQGTIGIIRGEKLKVGQAFLNLLRQFPDQKIVEIINKGARPGLFRDGGLQPQYSPDFSPKDRLVAEAALSVKENGVEYHIIPMEGYEGLIDALKYANLDHGGGLLGGFIDVAGMYTRTVAALATRWNPVFPVFNFTRDVQHAFIFNSEHGFRFALRSLRDTRIAWRTIVSMQSIRGGEKRTTRRLAFGGLAGTRELKERERWWQDKYSEYLAAGGKIALLDAAGYDKHAASLESLIAGADGATVWSTASAVPRAIGDFMEWLNDPVENAVRFAAYVNAREHLGMSPTRAAAWAKDLTLNFERKGRFGNTMNSLYMFSNAGVRGVDRMARGLKKSANVRALFASGIGTGALLTFASYLLGDDDDDGDPMYSKVAWWKRRTTLNFQVGDMLFMLPSPIGPNIPSTIGQALMEAWLNPEFGFDDIIGQTGSAIGDSMSPLGGLTSPSGHGIAGIVAPTFMDPLVDMAYNMKFTGRPIHPEWAFETRPDSAVAWPSATKLSRQLTEWLNELGGGYVTEEGEGRAGELLGWDMSIHPDTLDYLGSTLGGGLLRTLARSAEVGQRVAAGEPVAWSQVPFVRRLVNEQPYESQASGDYYTRREAIRQAITDKEAGMLPEGDMWLYRLKGKLERSEKKIRGAKGTRREDEKKAEAYLYLNRAWVDRRPEQFRL